MSLSICETVTDLHDRELIEHGDTSFPIACYMDDLSKANVSWHWHDEWEFVVVHEGCPEFLLENQKLYIPKGDGIFINGRALHAIKNTIRGIETPSGLLHSAVFHPRLIGGNTDSIFWQTLVQPFNANQSTRFLLLHADIPWEKEVMDHFESAWEAIVSERDDFPNIARYELSASIRALVKHHDFASSNLSAKELIDAGRIRTMLEYIEEHYNEDLDVDILSDTISVSSSACLRCFHKMLHTTPMQYVKHLRIKKSADLLLTTNKSAKEIAMDCGFNDISYYTRAFKEAYHMTPREYRRAHV